ncbi:MAG: ribose ABC transporter [Geminicoccaceae bacterium]|nr:ribose ABC transporter [Geminicoccaceae bacterium]
MLIGLDPLLSGDLLRHLRLMGHGDALCIADSNFPGRSTAERAGGAFVEVAADAEAVGRAILSVLPLDSFVAYPVVRMEPIGRPDEMTAAHAAFARMVEDVAGPGWAMGGLERYAFYEAALRCRLVVATLARGAYANFILTKGVVGPDGAVVRAVP